MLGPRGRVRSARDSDAGGGAGIGFFFAPFLRNPPPSPGLSAGFSVWANAPVATTRPAISNDKARRRIPSLLNLRQHHLAKRGVGELAIKSADAKLDAEPVAREAELLADIIRDRAHAAVV